MLRFLALVTLALLTLIGDLPAADVTLSVGASSPQGKVLTYQWTLLAMPTGAVSPTINQSGPAPGTGITDTAIATFVANALPGAYTFRATVSDGTLSATSDTVVTVMKSQTISFPALTAKTVLSADFAPGATASSQLPVTYASSNTTVATIISGMVHIVGTGTTTITASQGGNGTYTVAADVSQTLTVTTAGQTISFPALATKTIGDVDSAPGATASSGLPVTYTSSNTAVATIVNGLIHVVGAGTASITASQAGNGTYAATSSSQTLTVVKKSQTITFAGLPATKVGDADLAPGASATSGLTVAYTSSNTAVATIVSGKIHIVATGSATITANQAGDGTWAAASAVSQTLTVGSTALPPVITIQAQANPATLVLP